MKKTNNENTFIGLFNKAKISKSYQFEFNGIKVSFLKDSDKDILWLKVRSAMANNWTKVEG